MSLALTPEVLIGAYEYLRATEPFRALKLPHSDDVCFAVTQDRTLCGACVPDGNHFKISLSDKLNGFSATILQTMGHEMIHLYQMVHKRPGGPHGAEFRRIALRVCRLHGFDPKAFV